MRVVEKTLQKKKKKKSFYFSPCLLAPPSIINMSKRTNNTERKLQIAVEHGQVGVVREILRCHANLKPTEALLHEAWRDKPAAIIEALLKAGAPCDKLLSEAWPILLRNHRASATHPESWRMVALLKHANLNSIQPSLLFSCWKYPDVVKILLDHGADPNASDTLGWTPLMHVLLSRLGHAVQEELVANLLAFGADPSICAKSDPRGKHVAGANSLMMACRNNASERIVSMLLSTKVDINFSTSQYRGYMRSWHETAFSIAMECAPNLLQPLLDAGADPNLGTPTPLVRAITVSGDAMMTQLLLFAGARPSDDFLLQRWIRGGTELGRIHNALAHFMLLKAFGLDVPKAEIEQQCKRENITVDGIDVWLQDKFPMLNCTKVKVL